METIKQIEDFGRALSEALESEPTPEKRVMLLNLVDNYFDYLKDVQKMPLLVRLKFYPVAFALYDCLRVNKQLGRREGEFDLPIRREIRLILSKKYEEIWSMKK